MPPGRDSVQISLAKEHIVDALQLDGPSVLGLEEHRVAHFDAAHIGSDRYNLGPTEPAPHLRGGGNDDAPTGTPLAVLAALTDEHSIMQEFYRHRSIERRPSVGNRWRGAVLLVG